MANVKKFIVKLQGFPLLLPAIDLDKSRGFFPKFIENIIKYFQTPKTTAISTIQGFPQILNILITNV